MDIKDIQVVDDCIEGLVEINLGDTFLIKRDQVEFICSNFDIHKCIDEFAKAIKEEK